MTEDDSPKNLSQQIETILEPTDKLDPDLLSYLDTFFREFKDLEFLPPIDLTSPEAAREAIKILDKRKSEIASKLKIARALGHLLRDSQKL